MKQKLLAGVACLFAATPAVAADYGMAGCGLGSMVISDNSIMQIFAATTNGTSANQTFGITTGTSNCVSDGVVMEDKEQEAFTEVNYFNWKQDIAAGQGESLAAFVTLLGCDDTVRSDVYAYSQASYNTVFPNDETTSAQALYALKLQLSQVHDFEASCTRI